MQGGIPPCIPDSHLYRVTNTRHHIGMLFSPDDGQTCLGFPTKLLYAILVSLDTCQMPCLIHSTDMITWIMLVSSIDHEAPYYAVFSMPLRLIESQKNSILCQRTVFPIEIKSCTVSLRLTLHPTLPPPSPLFLHWLPFFNIDRIWWMLPKPKLTLFVLKAGGMFQDCTRHVRCTRGSQ